MKDMTVRILFRIKRWQHGAILCAWAVFLISLPANSAVASGLEEFVKILPSGDYRQVSPQDACPTGRWSWRQILGETRLFIGPSFVMRAFGAAPSTPKWRDGEPCQFATYTKISGRVVNQTVRTVCSSDAVIELRHELNIVDSNGETNISLQISRWEGKNFANLKQTNSTTCRYQR